MELNLWAVAGIVAVGLATFTIGFRSARQASTTQDFLVARRTVRSRRNAAAVSGEYLSAASFLGVAGLVLKDGADALWYPIGFTAGYLALMLFVAAPLRRSGAYSLPDFAEARLGSRQLRGLSTVFVVFIGMLYLVPQLQGAGLTLSQIVPGVPLWAGAVVVAVLVMVNVLGGGMRAITVVQAFQYWLKLFALAAPTFVLCVLFLRDGGAGGVGGTGLAAPLPPRFTSAAEIDVSTDVVLQVREAVLLWADGAVDGGRTTGVVYWGPGEHTVLAGTRLRFAADTAVPVVEGAPVDNATWLRPGSGVGDLFTTYSLVFATFLGTMGLPHVLTRFYTNPDGRAARRTTLHVMMLLSLFYLFPIVLGALARIYTPELLVTGGTDAAVLILPLKVVPGTLGQVLGAVTAAGAFAAFLSTSSGLVVSVAGVLSTSNGGRGRVRDFRWASVIAGSVPLGIALVLPHGDVSISVGLSFALAASTFCPVLLLGIWWPRITWVGAAAGMCVGGGLVLLSLAITTVSGFTGGWAPAFFQQPALVTVPVAFLCVFLLSKATASKVPPETNRIRMRMHAPDRLGFIRDRDTARWGTAEERSRLANGRHRR
ncbi:sodium/solute symporter [Actinokineospora spheciospongiae]|uniref:sodium/solute symporter n=1 Tax=Actinokineospora spheciospongiae TaxID=909613 RepID=UPI0005522F1C|nr:cation acetate symporter [Actinokineospora spheciospongiae]PWW62040.1 sodium:solute symporter family protein [Actinokineospora spheciospongiae]